MSPRPKSRLLFVSPCTPDPKGTGWEQRSFSFLLAYSRIMEVDLWFQPSWNNANLTRLTHAARLCRSIEAYELRVLRERGSPMNHRFERAIAAADHVHLFRLPFAIQHRSLFWDIDELPPGIRPGTRYAGAAPKPENELKVFAEFAPRCRGIFSSSPLERHPSLGNVIALPNVHQIGLEPPGRRRSAAPLLFVGSLSYPPNVDALHYYFAEIAPMLPKDLKLRIVGRAPQRSQDREWLEQKAQQGEIELFMDVESCTPHYAASMAAIVPLRQGCGTRVKIVEAFAHSCPVVSTSKGCEGLGATHGKELLIADTPADFAAACVWLKGDPKLRLRLGKKARQFFASNNSQQALEAQLFQALAQAGVDASETT